MKKIISILLCLVVCVSGLCMTSVGAADTGVATDNSDVLEMMGFLQSVGIIPTDYRELELNNKVTRADYVDAVAKLLGAEKVESDTPYFYDVPASHWAYGSICSLAARGIIRGNGNKLFRPDDTISMLDAYKIMLVAMGYGEYAEWNGGYPTGYLDLTRRKKLNRNIGSETELTYGNMCILLYNAADIGVMDATSVGTDGFGEFEESDSTLFSIYHGLYKGTGVLTGARGVTTEGGAVKKGAVEVDGVLYDSDIDLFDYLGEKIEFFAVEEEGNDEKTIIWARNADKTEVLHITADNDATFDAQNFTLKYYEDGKAENVSVARNAVMIYNGGIVNTDLSKYLNLPRYNAKLVGSGDSDYDLLVVSAYEDMVLGSIDSYNKVVYDKNDSTKKINFNENEYEYFEVVGESGAAVKFEELAAGNVLTVYQSADNKCLFVKVSKRIINGTVHAIEENGGGADILLDATTYYYTGAVSTIENMLGSDVTAYINVLDEAVYLEFSENDMRAAWLIDAGTGSSGIASQLELKILDSDGNVKVVSCKSKLRIDGETIFSTADQLAKLKEEDAVKQQLIMIGENDEKLITDIDTAYVNTTAGEGSNTLQVNVERVQGIWRRMTHNGYMVMDNTTKFFVIPENLNRAEDEDYAVVSYSNVPNERYRTWATSYKTKDKVGVEQYVVLEYNFRNDTPSGIPIIVENVRSTTNGDGEKIYRITGYQGSTAVTLVTDENVDCSRLTAGCVIRVSTNYGGEVTNIALAFDPQNIESGVKGESGFNNQYDYVYGPVREIVDGVVKIDKEGDDAWDRVADLNKKTVLVYHDERKATVDFGSVNDVVVGDYVCLVTQYGETLFMIVYK